MECEIRVTNLNQVDHRANAGRPRQSPLITRKNSRSRNSLINNGWPPDVFCVELTQCERNGGTRSKLKPRSRIAQNSKISSSTAHKGNRKSSPAPLSFSGTRLFEVDNEIVYIVCFAGQSDKAKPDERNGES